MKLSKLPDFGEQNGGSGRDGGVQLNCVGLFVAEVVREVTFDHFADDRQSAPAGRLGNRTPPSTTVKSIPDSGATGATPVGNATDCEADCWTA